MANQEFTTEELAAEEWRSVVGYERVYAVSSLGRVMRVGPGRRNVVVGRILRELTNPAGYRLVNLYRDGRCCMCSVHRLVLNAFIGPRPNLPQTNHIDAVKANNRLSNLEWCTHAENQAHATRLGLRPSGNRHGSRTHPECLPRGEEHARAKLTDDAVREIRKLSVMGDTYLDLATRFGVSKSTIFSIVRKITWKHIA